MSKFNDLLMPRSLLSTALRRGLAGGLVQAKRGDDFNGMEINQQKDGNEVRNKT